MYSEKGYVRYFMVIFKQCYRQENYKLANVYLKLYKLISYIKRNYIREASIRIAYSKFELIVSKKISK